MSGLRRHGHLLLAVGAALAAAALLAGAEAALRVMRPKVLDASPAAQPHLRSVDYGWTLRPGWRGKTSNGKPITVNALGFRGPIPGPKAVARLRVLMVGDSVVFGTDVGDDETFAARLGAPGSPLEVVNRGVSGYGTDQALLLLEREGFAHDPDVVVLNVCLANDLVDNLLPTYLYDGVTPKPRFVIEGDTLRLVPVPSLGRLGGWLVRLQERSFLLDALLLAPRAVAAAPMAGDSEEHWQRRKRQALENFALAASLTRRLVARMRDACAARGVELVVVLHPDRPAYLGDDSVARVFLDSELAEPLRMVDLRSTYRGSGLSIDEIFLDKSGHLSPQGHALAAGALAAPLSRGVLRRTPLDPPLAPPE